MNGVKAKQISDYAVTISVLLYVVACFLPTGVGYGNEKSMGCRGIVCLLMGWFGRNNSVEKPMLFLMSSLVWWAVFTAAGILMGVFGLFFHVIPLGVLFFYHP